MNITREEIIDNIKDIVPIDQIDVDDLVNLAKTCVESGKLEDTKKAILSFIRISL